MKFKIPTLNPSHKNNACKKKSSINANSIDQIKIVKALYAYASKEGIDIDFIGTENPNRPAHIGFKFNKEISDHEAKKIISSQLLEHHFGPLHITSQQCVAPLFDKKYGKGKAKSIVKGVIPKLIHRKIKQSQDENRHSTHASSTKKATSVAFFGSPTKMNCSASNRAPLSPRGQIIPVKCG